jgi:hypothetical protein
MGLTGSRLNRFRQRIDAVLLDVLPAELIFDGVSVAASSPGGRVTTEFIEGGESTNLRIPFRIPIQNLATAPVTGAKVDWKISDTLTIPLEVIEAPLRPNEGVWSITCRKRRHE